MNDTEYLAVHCHENPTHVIRLKALKPGGEGSAAAGTSAYDPCAGGLRTDHGADPRATKDFVIPLMAVDNVGVIEGWRRLLQMMKGQKAAYAGYLGMKIVMAIGASVVFGIASGMVAAIVMVPRVASAAPAA